MKQVRNVVIAGGGTAGWMAAAGLAKSLGPQISLTLVESEEIGTVGVGEATIPLIDVFNRALEIDQNEFMKATGATFKLGIEFCNWARKGDSYIHGFGPLGPDIGLTRFHQYMLKMHTDGNPVAFEDYSINIRAARSNKFLRAMPEMKPSPLAEIAHAYHFDAGAYARFLRKYAEDRGVRRVEGKITQVKTDAETGFVQGLVVNGQTEVSGDLFIDCTGFRGLLIEETLHTGYEDWSHWLPANRAWAVPCKGTQPLLPYTRSVALTAGWRWRIPLQHRTGNGHVFSSEFIDEGRALDQLMAELDGETLAEPRMLKFVTGKRKKVWNKNVVAVGLASGFLEPLESTSIHLIQAVVARLVTFFPDLDFDAVDIEEFNRQTDFDFEKIRDFIILHYKATERDDSEFWNHCRTMKVPDSLEHKMNLFRSSGRIFREHSELFSEVSWVEVMLGQRVIPQKYSPAVDALPQGKIEGFLANVRHTISRCVEVMPTHEDYIREHCASSLGKAH